MTYHSWLLTLSVRNRDIGNSVSSTPFASNFVVLLLKHDQEYFLRTYLNEYEVAVPGCGSPCPVRRMFTKWKKLTANCNVREMCDTDMAGTETKIQGGG